YASSAGALSKSGEILSCSSKRSMCIQTPASSLPRTGRSPGARSATGAGLTPVGAHAGSAAATTSSAGSQRAGVTSERQVAQQARDHAACLVGAADAAAALEVGPQHVTGSEIDDRRGGQETVAAELAPRDQRAAQHVPLED